MSSRNTPGLEKRVNLFGTNVMIEILTRDIKILLWHAILKTYSHHPNISSRLPLAMSVMLFNVILQLCL